MIQRGAALFDELVVVLGVNPDKKSFLSAETRMEVLAEIIAETGLTNVRVELMSKGFLVDAAERLGARYLLRGIRNTVDFEYEKNMERMNARMAPGIETVFLLPPRELEEISSSFIRGFVGQPGWEKWVQPCVPETVLRKLREVRSH